jgi:hypothetical protein
MLLCAISRLLQMVRMQSPETQHSVPSVALLFRPCLSSEHLTMGWIGSGMWLANRHASVRAVVLNIALVSFVAT